MNDLIKGIGLLTLALVIYIFAYAVAHTPSSNWNDGFCPNDGARYELRAVSGRLYQEYYECPVCGEQATK